MTPMKAADLRAAAMLLDTIVAAKELRATLKDKKYKLTLYAIEANGSMHSEVTVNDQELAGVVVQRIITDLSQQLKGFGVNPEA